MNPRGRRGRYRIAWFGLFCLLALLWPLPAGAEDLSAGVEPPVVVGGDNQYPPYEFLDERNQPTGFNVDLTRAIAKVMGMPVEIRLGSWGEMRKALANGQVDVLQGMVSTAERANEVDFSPPHAVVHQSIWNRRSGPQITRLDQLQGKEVIVMRGSVMHDFMLQQDRGATLIPVDSLAEALRLLSSGRHDCALVAKLPGQYLIRQLKLTNIAPVAAPLLAQNYGYAVRKGNLATLARFNEGLAILKETGEYRQIHDRWLGVLEPQGVPWGRIIRYSAMLVVPLLLVLGGTVVWSRTLQREVAARTEALEREVAERKRFADELQVRQKQLIQADKMTSLGILVSGVAHEINNPNGVIMLNVPLLQKAFQDALPILEEHHQQQGDFVLGWLKYSRMRQEIPLLFSETLESAGRIKRIVEDLKDFARRDDSDRSAAVDLNAVVEAALRLVDPSVRKVTGAVRVDFAPQLPKVRGNAQRIEQVVVNLVLNACQALNAPGQGISVVTEHLAETGEVRVTVQDEGAGIAAEHLDHLTDPFFTTKRDSGGTGLGLSVSAGIVKEHGGTLKFHSQLGVGTRVVLSLPELKET